MRVTKDKGSELHDADETREVEDFGVGVSTIERCFAFSFIDLESNPESGIRKAETLFNLNANAS